MKLSRDIIRFFEKQQITIVSTIDSRGKIHCAVKGIGDVEPDGSVYIVDLYLSKTFKNIKKNSTVSITTIDEKGFKGYTLQGDARIIEKTKIPSRILAKWEERLLRRISSRVIAGIQMGVTSREHHEAQLPELKYVIAIDVKKIIDLTPPCKQKKK